MIPKFFFLDTTVTGIPGAYASLAASRAGAEVALVTLTEAAALQAQGMIGEDAEILTLSALPNDELRSILSEMDRVWIFGDEAPADFVQLVHTEIGLPIVWQSPDRQGAVHDHADMVITQTTSDEDLLSQARDLAVAAVDVVIVCHGHDGIVFEQASNEALPFDLHGSYIEGALETFCAFFLTIFRQSENAHQSVRQAQFAVSKKLQYDGPLRETGEELAREMTERDDQQKG